MREALAEVEDSPFAPSAWQAFARAVEALRARLAEAATARTARRESSKFDPLLGADLLPELYNDSGPPGPELENAALTRRANLTVRPTVERLTRTLTLAPGAPSLPVCV